MHYLRLLYSQADTRNSDRHFGSKRGSFYDIDPTPNSVVREWIKEG
jgi:hypothetical protein